MANNKKRWYIVQTSSGKEDVVARDIMSRAHSLDQDNYIFDAFSPDSVELVEKVDKKNGTKTTVEKRTKEYPGYVFVEMIDTSDSWWVVRNTPNVTGFLGSSGNKTRPVPVDEGEMENVLRRAGKIVDTINFQIGDSVTITEGNFKDRTGTVDDINFENKSVTVIIDFFGKSTPITVGIDEVEAN
jgi:transcriptional antiterminator NusG